MSEKSICIYAWYGNNAQIWYLLICVGRISYVTQEMQKQSIEQFNVSLFMQTYSGAPCGT